MRKQLDICYSVPCTQMGVAMSGEDDQWYDVSVSMDASILHEISEHLHASERREGPVTLFMSTRPEEEEESRT